MADNNPRLHLICYDIADPRRLNRVHRCLVRHGLPLQYSVFLVYAHKAGLQAILAEMRTLIDHRKDDVRAYPLPRDAEYQHLGRQVFPAGVTVAGKGLNEQMFFFEEWASQRAEIGK
ncbi:MAG: CRISPR-associated endonuclease Cas2 [Gammaproteobacteria bacterium]